MKKLSDKEIKFIQLDLLEKVADFCQKNDITYYLAYGTLLGAVRHKGYIPWDDDIDLIMTRPNYDKFITNFNSKDSKYKVNAFELDQSFLYPFAKVSNEETVLIENTTMKKNIGINIDIFVIDSLPKKSTHILKKQSLLHKIYNLKLIKLHKNRSLFKNIILLFGKILFSWISLKKINQLMIKNAKRYKYGSHDYVCNINFGLGEKPLPIDVYQDTVELSFEEKLYPSMKKYDLWLTHIYGDYMTLPKKEEQVTHHDFKAYYKKERGS